MTRMSLRTKRPARRIEKMEADESERDHWKFLEEENHYRSERAGFALSLLGPNLISPGWMEDRKNRAFCALLLPLEF